MRRAAPSFLPVWTGRQIFSPVRYWPGYYFRLGQWDEALEQLDIIIDHNGGRFSLDQDPFEAFNRSDASRGNEVIWQAIYYDNEKGTISRGRHPVYLS
jgi:hypothetical protein